MLSTYCTFYKSIPNAVHLLLAHPVYKYAHESRDTIKQWSFDKVDEKAMQFPIPNVNIDI